MRLRRFLLATATTSIAHAFRDTSPFFAILPESIPSDDLAVTFARSSKIIDLATRLTSTCLSNVYVVVSQPGVATHDLQPSNSPHLKRRIEAVDSSSTQKVVAVPKIVGAADADAVAQTISKGCKVPLTRVNGTTGTTELSKMKKGVVKIDFPVPHGEAMVMRKNDEILHGLLEGVKQESLTMLYVTTPDLGVPTETPGREHLGHQMDYASHVQHPLQVVDFDQEHQDEEPIHLAWKRDTEGHIPPKYRRAEGEAEEGAGNATELGLFESYGFLSAGIFMGVLTVVLLLTILYIGLSAISGIEVSYASFNKETIQAMTKAQKQQ